MRADPIRVPFTFTRSVLMLLLIAMAAAGAISAAELGFDLKVERGRVAENMRLIRVKQGDIVTLRWISDQPLVVHLHGYDVEKRVQPGGVTEMKFSAHATGRFPIHVHQSAGRAHEEAPLINVEVYPR